VNHVLQSFQPHYREDVHHLLVNAEQMSLTGNASHALLAILPVFLLIKWIKEFRLISSYIYLFASMNIKFFLQNNFILTQIFIQFKIYSELYLIGSQRNRECYKFESHNSRKNIYGTARTRRSSHNI
jgi:hypothetical protein